MTQNVRQIIRKKLQQYEEKELQLLLRSLLDEKRKRKVGKKAVKK